MDLNNNTQKTSSHDDGDDDDQQETVAVDRNENTEEENMTLAVVVDSSVVEKKDDDTSITNVVVEDIVDNAKNVDGRNNDHENNIKGKSFTAANTTPAIGKQHDDDNKGGRHNDGHELRMLGYMQIMALVRKNILVKYRTPTATVFELFSPLLMMFILAAAYTLSEITYKTAKEYTTTNFDIPGPWFDIVQNSASIFFLQNNNNNNNNDDDKNITTSDRQRQRRRYLMKETALRPNDVNRIIMDGDDMMMESRSNNWNDILTGVQDRINKLLIDGAASEKSRMMDQRDNRRRLQFDDIDDDSIGSDDDEERATSDYDDDGSEEDIYDFLDDARNQLSKVLKGPMIVPSFDQFVELSLGFSELVGADELPPVFSDSSFGRRWGNLLSLGTLHLSPNNNVANSFWEYLNSTYPDLLLETTTTTTTVQKEGGNETVTNTTTRASRLKVRIHDNENEALRFIDNNLDERAWALLDFTDQESFLEVLTTNNDDRQSSTGDLEFKIRMNYTTVPNTNEITNWVSIGLNDEYQMYYLSGYLTLQRTINEFAFSSNENCVDSMERVSSIWSMPMPTAAYSQNPFFLEVGYLLGLSIVMAFLYPTSRLIKTIVEEKETRMKETLFILGLRGWAHWWSWFLTAILTFLIITLSVTFALTSTLIKYSDPIYVFAFIGLFSTANIGFCFTIAALFSKAKLSAIVGPLALFGTILPRFIFFGFNRYEATSGKMWSSLLPATAFAFAADILGDYEYSQQGIQAWNLNEGEYSFQDSLGMMFFDTILYIFLGWYLEQVMPREYGAPRPFHFLFTTEYWLGPHRSSASSVNDHESLSTTQDQGNRNFESTSDNSMVPGVQIKNLVKRYAKKSAVDGLNLTLFESQITTLLGHNGAGKTSTVSVLTGLYPPTSGDCVVYGKSIVHQLTAARESIGLCPQHNILFDSLTVYEHLAFFQRIKGIRPKLDRLEAAAREIGLGDFLRTASSALSGGNKRKLSVAIALSGDPKVLILDEPTSAMDAHSRRAVWELLREKRKGRVTLLTTHFMDEAELLSDRIAVMKEGKLQCCGSSMFLKNRFGLGYNLTVVLEPISDSSDVEQGMVDSPPAAGRQSNLKSQRDRLMAFLCQQIPNTVQVRMSGRELTFRFPHGSEGLFPVTFDKLEVEKQSFGISAFGVSNCSLEEVFIRLSEEGTSRKDEPLQESRSQPSTDSDSNSLPTEDNAVEPTAASDFIERDEFQHLSPLMQVGLLYSKRLTIQKRDMKGCFFQIVLPVLTIALVLLVLMLEPPFVGPAIAINPLLYEESSVGESGKTNILVGSGVSVSDDSLLRTVMTTRYDHVDYHYLVNATTSSDMSSYLLETYNDHNHHARFGAYVLDDRIKFSISIDFDELQDDLTGLLEGLNFSETLSTEHPIDWAVSVLDLSTEFYNLTKTSPDMAFNATDLLALTDRALQNVFSPRRGNSNSSLSADEWLLALERLVDTIEEKLVYELNSTSIGNITMESFSTLVGNVTQLIEENATMEELLDWVETVAVSRWDYNSSLNYLDEMARAWLANVTSGIGFNSTSEWAGVYANVTTHIDAFWEESTKKLNEYVSATLEDIIPLVNEFLYDFDRPSLALEMQSVLASFFQSLDFETERNASRIILANFAALDGFASVFNDSIPEMRLADNLAVAQLALTNSMLNQMVNETGVNATWTLGGLFSWISEAWGGTAEALDGSLRFQVASIVADPSSLMLSLSGIKFESLNEKFLDVENVTLQLPLDNIAAMIPNGTMEVAFEVESDASILHNSSSPHAVAAFNQAYLEYLYGTCNANQFTKLVSVNEPLPLTTQQSLEVRTILSVLAALFLLIPYGYIPGAFVVFLVKERVSKSKHLQLVSGVNMTSYWISTYLWDLTLYLMLTVCVMLVFLMYGNESAQVFVGDTEAFFATFLLTLGYGMSILPFAYLLARNFSNPSSAQISVIGVIFVTGFVAVNAYFIMSTIETTQDLAESLLPLFRMWPAYNVGEGFIRLSTAFWEREVLGASKEAFEWDVTGRSLLLLYLLAPVYFAILLLLEYSQDGGSGGYLGRALRIARGSYDWLMLRCHGVKKLNRSLLLDDGLDRTTKVDEDVTNEAKYVTDRPNLPDFAPVVLRELWKIYPSPVGILGLILQSLARRFRCGGRDQHQAGPPHQDDRSLPRRAVRGLTTAVEPGETFGLLGSNGAGKSTTLGILTGDIAPTGGEAFVAGNDISGAVAGGVARARKNIGFCPQIDPLLDLMTGRETLTMFAKLRGVPNGRVALLVETLLELLTLTPHADKNADAYSGGNKRKLSLGIAALVGNGGVLLIDESSSGLDPVARRKLWDLIQQLSEKRSVILTTHSMEEAEALCTRIGVMANGQFVAIGSVQHLKTKFLDGYSVEIKCEAGTPDEMVETVVSTVLKEIFPGSKLSERYGRFLKFEISRVSALGLGTTFRWLQELKKTHHQVEDYSVAQCSLEQVFIKLVNDSGNKASNTEPDSNVEPDRG